MKRLIHQQTIVGRDACRVGIAPLFVATATARYPETTRGIAPYKTIRNRSD
jgi:hypothetical protein